MVYSLILTMVVMAVILLASQTVMALWQERDLYFREKQALYLAESGIEYARAMLADNPSWKPQNPVSYGGGQFSVTLSGGNIISQGTYRGLTRQVTFRPGGGSTGGLGPILRSLHSEKALTVPSYTTINVQGNGYIGGNLTVNRSARAHFYNDLYLTGRLSVRSGGLFKIDGTLYQRSAAEPMAKPTWAELSAQAAKQISGGTITGQYDLGNGNLVAVDGDLDLEGDLEITGWGAFVVNGNLWLSGAITAPQGPVTIIALKNGYFFNTWTRALVYVYGTAYDFGYWGPNQIDGALWGNSFSFYYSDLSVTYDPRLGTGILWRVPGGGGVWSSP